MTNREYKLLSYIRSQNTVKWIDVLNAFDPVSEGRTNDAVLEIALDSGLIETPWPSEKPPRCSIRLTNKGILALLSTEEQMQQEALIRQENICQEQAKEQKELERIVSNKADREADRAAEHRFQIRLSFGNTVFGAVLGAFFSNLDRIIPWFVDLIERIAG